MDEIFKEMNNSNSDLEPFRSSSQVIVGQIVAAVFPGPKNRIEYHRAKVMAINLSTDSKQNATFTVCYYSVSLMFNRFMFNDFLFPQVMFIDFGNSEVLELEKLRRLRGVASSFMQDPPYCFECSLERVQPSQVNAPDGVWPTKATHAFDQKTDGKEIVFEVRHQSQFYKPSKRIFIFQIYSIVHGVVRGIVNVNGRNINEYLKDNSFAEFCDESFISKVCLVLFKENVLFLSLED